jgi:hypothetical protein
MSLLATTHDSRRHHTIVQPRLHTAHYLSSHIPAISSPHDSRPTHMTAVRLRYGTLPAVPFPITILTAPTIGGRGVVRDPGHRRHTTCSRNYYIGLHDDLRCISYDNRMAISTRTKPHRTQARLCRHQNCREYKPSDGRHKRRPESPATPPAHATTSFSSVTQQRLWPLN